ncbi:hypothetical protein ABZ543_33810 [Streptomyces roseifaciens]
MDDMLEESGLTRTAWQVLNDEFRALSTTGISPDEYRTAVSSWNA